MQANEIKTLRDLLGWTQDRLAEELGVQRTAVALWETGRNKPGGPCKKLLSQIVSDAKKKKSRRAS